MNDHRKTWDNYHRFSAARAELVIKILQQFAEIKNKRCLDIGCGNGATALKLVELNAQVTAIDLQATLAPHPRLEFFYGPVENFLFAKRLFDIVILQDVLEHLPDPAAVLKKIRTSLSTDSLIYISTPNRFSIVNVISDPHWGLPMISLFSRRYVKFMVKSIFRKDRRQRSDWAALLSLADIKKLFYQNNLELYFVNSLVIKNLFLKPERVVCRPLHIQITQFLKKMRSQKIVASFVNDRLGPFNYFINPTWYIIGKPK